MRIRRWKCRIFFWCFRIGMSSRSYQHVVRLSIEKNLANFSTQTSTLRSTSRRIVKLSPCLRKHSSRSRMKRLFSVLWNWICSSPNMTKKRSAVTVVSNTSSSTRLKSLQTSYIQTSTMTNIPRKFRNARLLLICSSCSCSQQLFCSSSKNTHRVLLPTIRDHRHHVKRYLRTSIRVNMWHCKEWLSKSTWISS